MQWQPTSVSTFTTIGEKYQLTITMHSAKTPQPQQCNCIGAWKPVTMSQHHQSEIIQWLLQLIVDIYYLMKINPTAILQSKIEYSNIAYNFKNCSPRCISSNIDIISSIYHGTKIAIKQIDIKLTLITINIFELEGGQHSSQLQTTGYNCN